MSLVPSFDAFIDDEADIQRESDLVHHIINESRVSDDLLSELDSVKQAIFCILATEQGVHPIYDENYGIKTLDLIGKDYSYAASELMRRIKESLLLDERVKEVKNLRPRELKDGIVIDFEVVTEFGNIADKYTKKMIGGDYGI